MVYPNKSAKSPVEPVSSGAMAPINVRVLETLLTAVKKMADGDGATLSEFVRDALANEISRRSLCKPTRPVSLEDLGSKLQKMQDLLSSQSAQSRLLEAKIDHVLQAMGVPLK